MTVTPKRENLISDPLLEQESQTFDYASIASSCQNSKAIFLRQAGILKDDSSLAELRNSIYQARGRSEIDDDLSS